MYGYWGGDSSSNCKNATVSVSTMDLRKSYTVNQQRNLKSWMKLDKYHLNSGDTVTVKLFGTDGKNLVADAFRLRRESAIETSR